MKWLSPRISSSPSPNGLHHALSFCLEITEDGDRLGECQ